MKRCFIFLICLMSLVLLTSCSFLDISNDSNSNLNSDENEYIELAIDKITEAWSGEEYYATTIKIINTNIQYIKSDVSKIYDARFIELYNRYLADVDFVVEFEILSNAYYNSMYYRNLNLLDSVVFYKDGRIEVKDLLYTVEVMYYSFNRDVFLEDVVDYGSSYNRTITL